MADLTNSAGTVNLWWKLPGGQTCSPNTLVVGWDGTIMCVSGYAAYSYSITSRTWTKQTAMGSGILQLAVEDAAHIWALDVNKNLERWTGSAWVSDTCCFNMISISGDGTLVGINTSQAIGESTNNGSTWTWYTNNTWTYVATGDAYTICAVSGGQVYLMGSSGFVVAPTQPLGTQAGCAISDGGATLLTWDTAGAVQQLSRSNGTWSKVTGLTVGSITTMSKQITIALDTKGVPYHWDVYGAYIGGQTTGSWQNGCPAPGDICKPSATHTGKLQVRFSSGHGINGTMQQQTVCFSCNVNISAWDANSNCDLIFGNPTDPECQVGVSGNVVCNQSGQTLENAGGSPSTSFSEDYAQWDTTRTIYPAVPVGNFWYAHGTCGVNHVGTCRTGTVAFCELSSVSVNAIEETAAEAETAAAYGCLKGPWTSIAVYVPNQPATCEQLAIFGHATIPGYCF